MNTLLIFVVLQSVNLFVFAWLNRVMLVRILPLRQQLGIQAQGEEAKVEKQGSTVLVIALQGLERLVLGADPGEA